LFFWKKKTYEIGSIKEIYFVGKYHSSNSMQIVFRNYRSKEFLAGSLREKNWLALKNRLESEGVPVENDFYLSL
jgi:hypothetical protein